MKIALEESLLEAVWRGLPWGKCREGGNQNGF